MPEPEVLLVDVEAWRCWLAENGGQLAGMFVVMARKGVVEPTSLTYDQALDEALCEGWIDGQVRRRDEATYAQRFTPRRPRSRWSARNVGLVTRLEADGRMCPRGAAQVAAARADGRWEAAYAGIATVAVPTDLQMSIAESAAAQAMWGRLTKTNRYALVYRTEDAKRPATRARRIAAFVAMLERGETPHPQRMMDTDPPPMEGEAPR